MGPWKVLELIASIGGLFTVVVFLGVSIMLLMVKWTQFLAKKIL
jgi:hypothetical protein